MMEDHGWAAYWSNGKPRLFILVHTASSTRKEVCIKVGAVWKHAGETDMQGWRRAYREGCRTTRIVVRPFGGTP
ncbi:hypothetical protein [Rhizobium leguminosarum]|uniref:hypothetical protein n=1 Tax=Rhizobium leguminosarum TaxID=384 RepID=UPI001031F059|nr:hypothetical protein ELI22_08625 [Rhizobium leguminosarum]TAV93851.1 hypothetical protein ELI21_08610 [Rhizobium leguminosarum]TAW34927.1 hypothetical protein ELI23_08650 [Rhizobium leguminosarum]